MGKHESWPYQAKLAWLTRDATDVWRVHGGFEAASHNDASSERALAMWKPISLATAVIVGTISSPDRLVKQIVVDHLGALVRLLNMGFVRWI